MTLFPLSGEERSAVARGGLHHELELEGLHNVAIGGCLSRNL